MENGSFNSVDIIKLLDPPSLRIDSNINANGDLAAHAASVHKINTIDLSKLPQNCYWTKSIDQSIPVNVRMPFEVVMKENIILLLGPSWNASSIVISSDENQPDVQR
ncbi:hypothetical protein OUZ56_018984 [Daphnia magna]|nr:hypothetical protein OUZ56_018984 [Daphnia magna]